MISIQLSLKIKEFIQSRLDLKLIALEKEQSKKKLTEQEFQQKKQTLIEKYQPNRWLTEAAKRAAQIKIVTHAAKFTNTDAKGSSFYADQSKSEEMRDYLSNSSLDKPAIDIVGNAASLDIAVLLNLSYEDTKVLDFIISNDTTIFESFTEDQQQASDWLEGFNKVLCNDDIKSHELSKQLYFPIGNGDYHVISPLFPSSLAQALYTKIQDAKFSEKNKNLRDAKKENKFKEGLLVSFPSLAIQSFGGTKPQNVSKLNTERKGKTYLLNCQPPQWKRIGKPPTEHKNQFWKQYEYRTRNILSRLTNFLCNEKRNNIEIRQIRADYINELIDTFITLATEIHNTFKPGWSVDSKLPQAEQFLLDPAREDSDFQNERQKDEWQSEIAGQFARWLNSKLKKEKLNVGDGEYEAWRKEFKNAMKKAIETY